MSLGLTIDVLGWLGAVALLVAYAGVSSGKLVAEARLYQLLNLAGSACLVVNAAWYRAFPSAFVNVVWISVAMFSLGMLWRRGRRAAGR